MSGAAAIRAVCETVGMSEPQGWGAFFDVVQAWDAKTDLTSARTDIELAEILFLDAAHVIRAGWTEPFASLVEAVTSALSRSLVRTALSSTRASSRCSSSGRPTSLIPTKMSSRRPASSAWPSDTSFATAR